MRCHKNLLPAMLLVISESKTIHPTFLVQVHQHSLFQLVLTVVDCNGIIMSKQLDNSMLIFIDMRSIKPVKTMDESLDARLDKMSQH